MITLAQRACHTIAAFGCAAAFLATPAIHAQSTRWLATGPLNVPRYAHTATLLADGSVLVVGGSGPDGALASAERYDPVSGKWRVVASPAIPRDWHTATLLFDGKVLVVGGSERPEIYDPVTDTWSMVASTAVPHFVHTATRLANGKVLVVGGAIDLSTPLPAELYDPATGLWAAAGIPRWSRIHHTATLLVNGTLLVAGGISNNYPDGELPDPQKAEIYDPATNSWREVGAPLRVAEHTATLLANGKVLLIRGGVTVIDFETTAELFDPASDTWRSVGRPNTSRLNHTATLLTSGKVLVAGSGALRGNVSTAVETYDPTTERFTNTDPLGIGRQSHTATRLANGYVLVTGGMGHAGDGFPIRGTAELYVPSFEIGAGLSGTWYDPAQSGHGLFLEVLPDNRLLAGWFAFNPVGTAQAWFWGVGTYSGDTATITSVVMPTGGSWIPNFNPSSIVHNPWGTLTFRFTDCDHGIVSFNSPSFGAGSMSLTRLTQPLGLSCR